MDLIYNGAGFLHHAVQPYHLYASQRPTGGGPYAVESQARLTAVQYDKFLN